MSITPIGSLPIGPYPTVVTLRGRITGLSQIYTEAPHHRTISYYRLRLTDATGSALGTVWERNHEHALLGVGMEIIVRNAVVGRSDPYGNLIHMVTFDIPRRAVLEIL